jgi:hypothetical protein
MKLFGKEDETLEQIKERCEKTSQLSGEFEKATWVICVGNRERWGEPVKEVCQAYCSFDGKGNVSLFRTKEALADYNKKVAQNQAYEREWKPKFQAEYDNIIKELTDKGRPKFEMDIFKNKALCIRDYLPWNPRCLSGLCDFRFDLNFIHVEIQKARAEFDKGLCGRTKFVPLCYLTNGAELRGPQPLLRIQFGQ